MEKEEMSFEQEGGDPPPPKPQKLESSVPQGIQDSVKETLACTEAVRSSLDEFLAAAGEDPDELAELPPLLRARSFLVLAKTATSLLSVQLRCNGIDPDEHPITKEFERLSMCQEKLDRFEDWNRAPLCRSTKVNTQAAARFIGQSLPHLSNEQRKSLRDISRGQVNRHRSADKRAHKKSRLDNSSFSEGNSVRLAAKEFLEKAARELMSSNNNNNNSNMDIKGPLRILSDQED